MKVIGYLSGDAISRDRERMEEHAARFGKPYPHELVIKADAEAAIKAAVAARDDQWATAIAKYAPFDICKMIADEMERGAAHE